MLDSQHSGLLPPHAFSLSSLFLFCPDSLFSLWIHANYLLGLPLEAGVEANEWANSEDRVREGYVARLQAFDDYELLDDLGGEELEPARELGTIRVHVAAEEVDAGEVPRVCLEDARDGGE